ncbi:MAG: iron transporter, partial [Desulfobacterales bacterium]
GALLTCALATLELAMKMVLIIVVVMIILEGLKTFDLVPVVVRIFAPVLWLMGLNRRVGLLWLTAVLFGITYGGAVIVQEARRGGFSREDIESLHLSIGVNHSMIEDPALFLTLGLHPFWMWIPRLVAAVLIVHIARLGFKMVKTGKDSAFPDA